MRMLGPRSLKKNLKRRALGLQILRKSLVLVFLLLLLSFSNTCSTEIQIGTNNTNLSGSVKRYKKSRDRTLAEQIQNWAVRKFVPSGGQVLVTPIQKKEAENRALAWAYYWGESLSAAVSDFDYVEQGGQELRAAKATVLSSTTQASCLRLKG